VLVSYILDTLRDNELALKLPGRLHLPGADIAEAFLIKRLLRDGSPCLSFIILGLSSFFLVRVIMMAITWGFINPEQDSNECVITTSAKEHNVVPIPLISPILLEHH
jgi:hypothetical protein